MQYTQRLGLLFITLICSSMIVSGFVHFDHVIIFMFENHSYDEVTKDPNFSSYAAKGRQFTNYFAITHPSQPNYFCQTAGDYFGINSDNTYNLSQSNIVDLLENKHITWKAYMEDYPGDCYSGAVAGKYYRKHNPFVSFDNVRNNATRCAKIVNATQLDVDLKGTLPQYMYYTPNIDNDAHNTNIAFAGTWLNTFLSSRLSSFPSGTLFVVTWDEDDHTEGNQIDTFVWGSMVTAGEKDYAHYTHYSLLRTIEDNFGLGNLGRNDATATAFNTNVTSGGSSTSAGNSLKYQSWLLDLIN